MAASGEGGGKDDIKTHFITREGTYRLMPLSEYSKPTRGPYNGQTNTPVKVSFIDVDVEDGTSPDRICFNVGRELYFYEYKGVRKVAVSKIIVFIVFCNVQLKRRESGYRICNFSSWHSERNLKRKWPLFTFDFDYPP